jgi:hypothetical protein
VQGADTIEECLATVSPSAFKDLVERYASSKGFSINLTPSKAGKRKAKEPPVNNAPKAKKAATSTASISHW